MKDQPASTRSFCSYDHESDTYAVTVRSHGWTTNYLAPGEYIRTRFKFNAPRNGDVLAQAIQYFTLIGT